MNIASAKREQTCKHCRDVIRVGAPIAQIRRIYEWIHAECALELQQMRRDGKDRRMFLRELRVHR